MSGKIGAAAELLRKGATLLETACPKCGGVQLRYRGQVTCVSCGELKVEDQKAVVQEAKPIGAIQTVTELRTLLLNKAVKVGNQLQNEESSEKQKQLLSLLLSYLEALDKASKIAHERAAEM